MNFSVAIAHRKHGDPDEPRTRRLLPDGGLGYRRKQFGKGLGHAIGPFSISSSFATALRKARRSLRIWALLIFLLMAAFILCTPSRIIWRSVSGPTLHRFV